MLNEKDRIAEATANSDFGRDCYQKTKDHAKRKRTELFGSDRRSDSKFRFWPRLLPSKPIGKRSLRAIK